MVRGYRGGWANVLMGPHRGVILKGYKLETEGARVALKGVSIWNCFPSGRRNVSEVVENPSVMSFETQIRRRSCIFGGGMRFIFVWVSRKVVRKAGC